MDRSERKERIVDAIQVVTSVGITAVAFFLMLPHLEFEIAIRIPSNLVGLVLSLLLAIPILLFAFLLMKHTLLLYFTKYRRDMYVEFLGDLVIKPRWPLISIPLAGVIVWYFAGLLPGIIAAVTIVPLGVLVIYVVTAQAVEDRLGWGVLDHMPLEKPKSPSETATS